ncbi:MAG: TetR/AcrR family transcriptional regulator [Chitinophagales bacterium]
MQDEGIKVVLNIDDRLFLKDPNSSEVGKSIIEHSILLISKIGFESFTFKKLAKKIGITEPSVYRYFKNKHKLLFYLLSWYWIWMKYKIDTASYNISSAEQRLKIAIKKLSEPIEKDDNYKYIDEVALYNIVIAESSKVYLTKEVDRENKEGLFKSYQRLCQQISDIIKEINPEYRFPTALVSTTIESSHSQKYFAEHLPYLTEVTKDQIKDTTEFLTELILKTIKN